MVGTCSWGSLMLASDLVRQMARDERLTRGLGDVESRILIEWLECKIDQLAHRRDEASEASYRNIYQHARHLNCFFRLWSNPKSRGSAIQLVGSQRWRWPIPHDREDPGLLMQRILFWFDRENGLHTASDHAKDHFQHQYYYVEYDD